MRRMQGAILDALRQLDWVPRSVRSKEQKLRRVTVSSKRSSDGLPPMPRWLKSWRSVSMSWKSWKQTWPAAQ